MSDTPTSAVRIFFIIILFYFFVCLFVFLRRVTPNVLSLSECFPRGLSAAVVGVSSKHVTLNPQRKHPLFTVNSVFTESCWLAAETENRYPPIKLALSNSFAANLQEESSFSSPFFLLNIFF